MRNLTVVKPLVKFATKTYLKAISRGGGGKRLTKTVFFTATASMMSSSSPQSSSSSSSVAIINNQTEMLDFFPRFCNKSVKSYEPIEQAFYGYGLPCLSLLGVLANIVNIIVLTDSRLTARTYTFLAFLAFTDLITLVLYFVDLLAKIHFAGQLWHEIFTAYIYQPIGTITTTSSLMLTVAFTIDRFIHLQDPRIHTGKPTLRERTINRLISAGIVVLSAIINLPRLFPVYVDMKTGCRTYHDYAKKSDGWFSVYSYARLAILNVGSIILLAIFNTLLIVFVHRSTARTHRETMGSAKLAAHHSQQRSLTLTLIAATLLALAGEIPSTLLNRTSAAVLWGSGSVLDRQPFRSLTLLTYTLLLIEYGGNFITYFLLNKRFHALLCLKLCPTWAEKALNSNNNNDEAKITRCGTGTTTNGGARSSAGGSAVPITPVKKTQAINLQNLLETEDEAAAQALMTTTPQLHLSDGSDSAAESSKHGLIKSDDGTETET